MFLFVFICCYLLFFVFFCFELFLFVFICFYLFFFVFFCFFVFVSIILEPPTLEKISATKTCFFSNRSGQCIQHQQLKLLGAL